MAGGKVPVHFKVVASEEYEAVVEERPPRIECLWWLHWCCGGSVLLKQRLNWGIDGHVFHEDDNLVEEEFWFAA